MSDFHYDILTDRAHRPWPMPASPWIMTQTWHDLLFAHWPIDPSQLASRLPVGLELDVFDRQAWIGIVPFRMTNVAPRGVPSLPWLSAFPELNVRTYVRAGGKPGVFFFSLDATNPIAVAVARRFFHLPYFKASMMVSAGGDVSYASRRKGSSGAAELLASYRPAGPVFHAEPGSIEYFLTERYCLYTTDRRRRLRRLEIHHPRWPLQRAEAEIRTNRMAECARIALPARAPLLHFAKRQDVVAWPLTRVENT